VTAAAIVINAEQHPIKIVQNSCKVKTPSPFNMVFSSYFELC